VGKRLLSVVMSKCLRGVAADRRYLGSVSKFLGFLLGVAVALAGPAVFGVLAAPGGIELNAKGMALAFGIGALVFWAVVSYFTGAGALGAFVAFGTMVYCWLWIPNRTTNFLNDVPGITNGMVEGSKTYTLNGVVPILTVISLVYAIQLIVRGVQRRRRERAEAARVQREAEAAQAQQEAEAAAVYPVAGGNYPESSYSGTPFGGGSRYDDVFDEEPVRPRNQAEDQTAAYPVEYPEDDARGNEPGEETQAYVPVDEDDEPDAHEAAGEPAPVAEDEATQVAPESRPDEATQVVPENEPAPAVPEGRADETTQVAPENQPAEPTQVVPESKPAQADEATQIVPQGKADDATQVVPASKPDEATQVVPEARGDAATQVVPESKPDETRVMPEVKGQPEENRMQQAPVLPVKETMGSQYRERMDDPEDTGEFHLTAFENPIIRPA
jgi:hypothetical protein